MRKNSVIKVLIAVFAVLIGFQSLDVRLRTVFYKVNSGGETEKFRIVFISDLHSDKYGENMEVLLSAVDAQAPDCIFFGGDVVDDERPWDNTLVVLEDLSKKYPCFYAPGNHEIRSGKFPAVKSVMENLGVTVLDEDPVSFGGAKIYGYMRETFPTAEEGFNILLAHWPEDINEFSKAGFDLMLSGHAHGGQWRLPFFQNGLYSPGQGFFPKYSGGRFEVDGTTLIVSRGLARESTEIPRIFNRPELIVIDIV